MINSLYFHTLIPLIFFVSSSSSGISFAGVASGVLGAGAPPGTSCGTTSVGASGMAPAAGSGDPATGSV
jgi:hypothetical protein